MFNRHNNFLKKICADFGLTPAGIEYALQQYQTVICELTNSRLSKLTYSASIVCQEAYNCFEDDFKENNKPEWISVKDRLPPAYDTCITAIKDDSGDTAFRYVYFGWYLPEGKCWIIDDKARTDVYAWMPLSEPPKEDGNESD